jgi:Transcriptional regulatory protein, C terminal
MSQIFVGDFRSFPPVTSGVLFCDTLHDEHEIRVNARARLGRAHAAHRRPRNHHTKDDLMSRIWRETIVEESNLQVQISALRKMLGEDRHFIRTIAGRGYQFVAEVAATPAEPHIRETTATQPMVSTAAPTNVPVPASDLIGRDAELADVAILLGTHRLVTLTGAGGIGKPRLGMEIARHALTRFPDGVWLAELGPLSDPDLVPVTVATALGLELPAGAVSPEHVAAALGSKQRRRRRRHNGRSAAARRSRHSRARHEP